MKNTAGEKVNKIINEEFDGRVAMAVITYILDKGFDFLKQLTEEDIFEVKGNGLMTDRFCQTLVRTAAKICKECDEIDDFLPFIVNHLYVPNAKMKEATLYQDEMTEYKWKEFIDCLDIEYEESADEIKMVTLNINVIETVGGIDDDM